MDAPGAFRISASALVAVVGKEKQTQGSLQTNDWHRIIFVLANPGAQGQTDSIMKNFPRAAKICAANALVILSIIVVQACARHLGSGSGRNFELAFENTHAGKRPRRLLQHIKKGS